MLYLRSKRRTKKMPMKNQLPLKAKEVSQSRMRKKIKRNRIMKKRIKEQNQNQQKVNKKEEKMNKIREKLPNKTRTM